ncbi:MAG: HEAT repeat domain-containing protein [Anaerolineae bacterium]|nr:HEAT repeat domain-containing protein [Anaerolineae bacterium]
MKRFSGSLLAFVTLVGGALACGQGSAFTSSPTAMPSPTPTPLPLQAPGWEDVTVHTLCLAVEQAYPGIEGKEPEPIAEATQRILARVGLQVVAEGASCDATLTLTLTGQALGDRYTTGYCYSGAEVSGLMVFDVAGREPLTLPVAGRRNPPFLIRGCPQELGAPFGNAWSEALLGCLAHLWGPQVLVQAVGDEAVCVREAAAEALGEVEPEEGVVPALAQALGDTDEDVREAAAEALEAIGPQAVEAVPALIQALKDRSSSVRCAAARALGEIGPGAREAVPALIQALGDESSLVRQAAAEALRAITGQDFGEDAERWRQWWEAHQSETPVPPPSGCTPDAVFEGDVTIPDGTQIKVGQTFVKTWRIRNTGTCDWDASYRLVFVDGEQMSGVDSVAVPETPAGEVASVSVDLVAPLEGGTHRGYWRMCVGEKCFGDRVYVEIVSTE